MVVVFGINPVFNCVAGISFCTTENALSEVFSQYGQVVEGDFLKLFICKNVELLFLKLSFNHPGPNILRVFSAKVVTDRVSGKSKGFGFVTFASVDEAHKALTEMNGKVIKSLLFPNRFLWQMISALARGASAKSKHRFMRPLTCSSTVMSSLDLAPTQLASVVSISLILFQYDGFGVRRKWQAVDYWQAVNGRVIFVDYAKPKTNFREEIPIARGPPEPQPDTWLLVHKHWRIRDDI